MEVILLETIHNVGQLGDKVKVRPGYGRNFLIPQGKAVFATPENVEKFEAQRAELEKAQAEALTKAQERADKLNTVSITIARKASGEGKLFGSVSTIDIAEAVTETGNELAKQEVLLPDGPFRSIGTFEVHLQLHADIQATITLNVVAEED
ncbi:MAG: 50S ribosomal protein L9 [Gammaproteobacteria bacterium]|nr:50S ribosomal protein L9 [Gammaproteobacteria bacterium]NIN62294.1 50S ribosomal protein L9 [Gammaproteobacteria bacterium]NIO62303.1 50S ribosomal protein L9 [Gammaproteobacteria bacterium]NIP49672.1 50S ribosomal protein L9 [Gammaproteobacteria bacterium]NIQ10897.1 50S ribosomal protein L9 [Gammaproteobacteria bacterium]